MLVGIGPVAVFGASNFPLAIGVACTDTVGAFAARCPVVVKAHPGHPGTCELTAELIVEAIAKAGLPAGNMQTYATLLDTFEFEETIGNSLVVKEPVGVVGAITPWNYPLHQIICKLGGALAAGCTFVLKPSEVAPLNAFILAEIIHEVGLPAGVFNMVSGTGPVVGAAISEHPGVDMVSFTGSTRAGKQVAAAGHAQMIGYDLKTGAEQWFVNCVPSACCASPMTEGGILYFAGWSPGGAEERFAGTNQPIM
jgi:acyl-CoA reductase-like NAD-dependent aldehyde dehydrogenase